MAVSESIPGLRDAYSRFDRLKRAVASLDAKIANLRASKPYAKPGEEASIARQIRELGEDRVAAVDVLDGAEAALAAKRDQHRAAVAEAGKNLGKIGQVCGDAASRFDRALRDAAAALEEIERAAEPLDLTLLPARIRDFYLHQRHVNAAVAFAFQHRLTGGLVHQEKKPMRERVAEMIAAARAEHVRLKQAREAA